MKTKVFLTFSAFCLLCLALTGCSSGRVQSAASKLEDDVSNAISRVESALDPDDNVSSGLPDESQQSSMPGYSSSQTGDADGNGTQSDGQVSSNIDGDESIADDESSGDNTKDL